MFLLAGEHHVQLAHKNRQNQSFSLGSITVPSPALNAKHGGGGGAGGEGSLTATRCGVFNGVTLNLARNLCFRVVATVFLGNRSYTSGKPVYFPFKLCHI